MNNFANVKEPHKVGLEILQALFNQMGNLEMNRAAHHEIENMIKFIEYRLNVLNTIENPPKDGAPN